MISKSQFVIFSALLASQGHAMFSERPASDVIDEYLEQQRQWMKIYQPAAGQVQQPAAGQVQQPTAAGQQPTAAGQQPTAAGAAPTAENTQLPAAANAQQPDSPPAPSAEEVPKLDNKFGRWSERFKIDLLENKIKVAREAEAGLPKMETELAARKKLLAEVDEKRRTDLIQNWKLEVQRLTNPTEIAVQTDNPEDSENNAVGGDDTITVPASTTIVAVAEATSTEVTAKAPVDLEVFTEDKVKENAAELAETIFKKELNAEKHEKAVKKFTIALNLGKRVKALRDWKAAADKKKAEADEKKAEADKKNLRRLAVKEVVEAPVDQLIQGYINQVEGKVGKLVETYNKDFKNVKTSNYSKFDAEISEAEVLLTQTEALIKLQADESSKAADLKKANAMVLGFGIGFGLGIPLLTAAVFTFLVKTKRVLLNVGSSADV